MRYTKSLTPSPAVAICENGIQDYHHFNTARGPANLYPQCFTNVFICDIHCESQSELKKDALAVSWFGLKLMVCLSQDASFLTRKIGDSVEAEAA